MSPLRLVEYAGATIALAIALLVLFLIAWFILDTIRSKRP